MRLNLPKIYQTIALANVKRQNSGRPASVPRLPTSGGKPTFRLANMAIIPARLSAFHNKVIVVTNCGRICLGNKKINFSIVFAGHAVGIKEVHDDIWLVSFMDDDLEYFDLDTRVLELESPNHPPNGQAGSTFKRFSCSAIPTN